MTAGPAPPRRTVVGSLGVLRHRNLRRFLIGQTTSLVGSSMAPIAIAFAVLAHGSPSDLGYVLAATTTPLIVVLLIGGVIADRLGRRTVMLGADTIRFVAHAVLGIWVITGRPPLSAFILLEAVIGIGNGLFSPSLTGLIPELVDGPQLLQANALNGLASSGSRILGPVLAGTIVAAASPGWAIAADSASFLVSAIFLSSLRLPSRQTKEAPAFIRELKEGWREVSSRVWIWAIIVQYSFCNALTFAPILILGAVIAKQSYGGAGAWGAILACQGGGAIVGGLVLLRVRPHRPLLTATLVTYAWVFPLLALAFRIPVALVAFAATVSGFSIPMFGGLWDTTLQQNVPSALLSRVSAYDWLGSLVLLPIAEAMVGPLSKAIGIRTTLIASAAFVAVTVTVVLMIPAVSGMRSRELAVAD